MNFQIAQLIIWPKNTDFPPQIVHFELGKLNVITGASRTGKSAIIPIIDYCLASTDCNIPIDTIRDFTSWYGLVIQNDDERILLCRKVPEGNKASMEFYIQRGKSISIPNKIEETNERLDGVKHILNAISSVPYIGLEEEKGNSFKSRLSFRDLMALVFQSQDIVANQNIIFYKTHAHEHREKLRNWLPFILGAETTEILAARQRLEVLNQRINQLQKEYQKSKAVSDSWLSNMVGHLKVAKEYGLIATEIETSASTDDLLSLAREVLQNIPDFSNSAAEDINDANDEFKRLEVEEATLSYSIAQVKKRLGDLQNLKGGLLDYGNTVRKRVDRLHISKWLKDVSTDAVSCPVCGSPEHPKAKAELNKIATVFEKYENESRNVADVPTSFTREEERLKGELDDLINKKKAYQERFDLLLLKDRKAQEEFQRRKNMYLFLGHLKASFETFEKITDGGVIRDEISELEEERDSLLEKVDAQGVQRRLEVALSRISGRMLNHLKTLDVEDKYRKIGPRFDIQNLSISILSSSEHWHLLAQVGSASNWVSFHVALVCALQEFFIEQKNPCVPNFVIFDQPSQVYFPKLRKGETLDDDDKQPYEDEDVSAVKMIFNTIEGSVRATDGQWQAIVLDHADSSIYGDLSGVHEVAVWRNGEKLIPETWITSKS